jgi:hypothetical protein
MLDLAQHRQDTVSIPPVGQLLVRETGRRQHKSSYGHALDHGPFRFCVTIRNGMLCRLARPRTAGSVLPNACAISSGRHPAAAIASSC